MSSGDASVDWYAWHAPYDELTSPLSRQLRVVQDVLVDILDEVPEGPVRLVSIASGQSRDVLPMLIHHRRGRDVQAVLVERDARNADFAEGAVLGAALDGVHVIEADAGQWDVYAGACPADVVLACGLFDLLDDEAVEATIAAIPQLCASGAAVVWTGEERPWGAGDRLLGLFLAAGFTGTSTGTGTTDADVSTVGVVRWGGPDGRVTPGTRPFDLS